MNLKRISKFNIFNTKQNRSSIIILLLFIHYSGLSNCLSIKDLIVPSFVRNGSAIYLFCDFELGTNEELYSVKWYKDNVEFYRYLPSNEPHQGKFYRLKGIHVDLQGSNSTHVLLYRLEVASEGTYSCEVSTDQFITAVALKQLKVYALPQDKLRIEGSEFEYDVGHLINLTCICPPTKPTAQLAWYINGKKAPSNLLIKYSLPKNQTKKNYLETSKLGLVFQTKRSDFANGQLWLKCVASLILSYNFETSQNLDNLKTASEHRIMANTGKVLASSTSSSDLYLKQKETPVINGLRTTYHVGDSLNLNCSTTEKDAKLKWYINDKLVNSSYIIHYTNNLNSNDKLKNEIKNDFYESKPYQLNNVYYNNGANAHELKRRTFSIQKTYTNTKINGIRRSLNYPNILKHIQSSISYNETKQILGLQIPLQQHHFQYDVKLKCESTIHKHVAQLEQSLKILSENHELARMQSSIAFAYSKYAYHQLTQLLLTLFSLFVNKLYLNNLQN